MPTSVFSPGKAYLEGLDRHGCGRGGLGVLRDTRRAVDLQRFWVRVLTGLWGESEAVACPSFIRRLGAREASLDSRVLLLLAAVISVAQWLAFLESVAMVSYLYDQSGARDPAWFEVFLKYKHPIEPTKDPVRAYPNECQHIQAPHVGLCCKGFAH